ncbi:MAG: PAS domain S-box protein, partial [Verrucomicrobiaceae bacterium]
MDPAEDIAALRSENQDLRARLEEAEDTLRAIRDGEVDALVTDGPAGPQVFVLQTADTESARFRGDILGKVSDAVIAIDEERRLIYMNAAAEEQYGVQSSFVLGRDVSELLDSRWHQPEDQEDYQQTMARTGAWRGRNIHVKRDGTSIEVESTVSRLYSPDGRPVGRLAVIRDMTGQRAAEEALRENQARLQLTLESARIGDWDLDLKADKSRRSLLHDQLFGYREPVAHWGFKQFLHHVHPEDRTEVKFRYRHAMEHGSDWQAECRIIWPNGAVRWINLHASIFRDEHGEPSRMLGVIFDISARKQAEEALRENEALFSTIIDQAPGGVYVIDDRFRMM